MLAIVILAVSMIACGGGSSASSQTAALTAALTGQWVGSATGSSFGTVGFGLNTGLEANQGGVYSCASGQAECIYANTVVSGTSMDCTPQLSGVPVGITSSTNFTVTGQQTSQGASLDTNMTINGTYNSNTGTISGTVSFSTAFCGPWVGTFTATKQ